MRKLQIHLLTLVLILCTPAWAAKSSANQIDWLSYDSARISEGKQSKKYFLYFNSKHCGYCRMLENKTFKDKEIVDYINANYTPVMIDVNENQKIATRYKVNGVPALHFLTDQGETIANWVSYVEADHLIKMLKYIHTDSYQKMNFQQFDQNLSKKKH
ncbi:MAG: thioredoxin fold domain-containing protein [Desulfobacteraceae bacterium]|nr:thioredoxin fold domain-containing protein [Desulfobacteraceae bacterium]